jgi:uncharacterized lipoprotein YmbA
VILRLACQLTLALVAAVLAGCVGSPAPPTRFYALQAASVADQREALPRYFVTVGPVSVPASVDRPQIVVTAGATEVRLLESARWAAPLRNSIAQVLAEEIERRLPQARVLTHDEHLGDSTSVRILVDIRAFDSFSGDSVRVDAVWRIRSGKQQTSGRRDVREPVMGREIADLVQAHVRALAVLADDIALAVRRQGRPSE